MTHKVTPGLPKLAGDLDRLQQLFINLVDNAIKYTPAGGQVSLTATSSANQNDNHHRYIEITVSDTGPGIPEKDLPRLTERFYRVDKARSRDLGGTGLGLAIVKHIVQAHKGELTIESVLKKGTTVRVRLPVAVEIKKDQEAILFLCVANSCRSQMAEGFARHLAADRYKIYSAGTEPKSLHPLAVRVMHESGIDISKQYAKGVDAIPLDRDRSRRDAVRRPRRTMRRAPVRSQAYSLAARRPTRAVGDAQQVISAFPPPAMTFRPECANALLSSTTRFG